MIDQLGKLLTDAMGGNVYLMLLTMSALPVVELRGAVIFLTGMLERSDMGAMYAGLWCCIAGSTSVILPVILLTRPMLNRLKRSAALSKFASKAEDALRLKAQKATDGKLQRSRKSAHLSVENDNLNSRSCKISSRAELKRAAALATFVAIPLPMTGVWSGSLAGAFTKLPIWKAALAVFLGNVAAAHLLLAVCLFVPKQYADVMLFAFAAAAITIALSSFFVWLKRRERPASK